MAMTKVMTCRRRIATSNSNEPAHDQGGQGGHDNCGHCGHGSESDNDAGYLCIEDLAHIDADVEADCFVSQKKSELSVLQSVDRHKSNHHSL